MEGPLLLQPGLSTMPAPMLSAPYAEQIEADAARLKDATGLTHHQYIEALRLLVTEQLRQGQFDLAEHQLPIPS